MTNVYQTFTDHGALEILREYIAPEDFRDHGGEPPFRPEMLWGLFRSYTENYAADRMPVRALIPEGAPSSGVTALEGLTAARVLAEQIQASYWWIVAEARKGGASWSDIGRALGMSKQAAHQAFREYAEDPGGTRFPGSFRKLQAELLTVAADGPGPEDELPPGVRVCSGCRGAGVIPTEDGEDAFECTVCDGSGLAGPVPGRREDYRS